MNKVLPRMALLVGEQAATERAVELLEHDNHVSRWEYRCRGSSRVYALVGRQLAEAMKGLLRPEQTT